MGPLATASDDAERARRAAGLHCLAESGPLPPPRGSGPLAGLSFVAKDLVALRGHASSFGHPRWRSTHEPARETAPLLESLLAAGARLVGFAKMDQLAYSLVGDVGEGEAPVNPLDPDRFAGGSSSGSASAVAGGVADFAVCTDTAGSARAPAAACGVYGVRPTHGLVDSRGVLPLSPSFDTPGLFARDAGVLARALAVLAGREEPPAAGASPLEEVLVAEDALDVADPAPALASRVAARALGDALGLPVRGARMGPLLEPWAAEAFTRLQAREIWAAHGAWVEAHADALAPEVRARLDRCRALAAASASEREGDLRAQRAACAALESLVEGGRVLVLPVMRGTTPRRDAPPEDLLAYRQSTLRLTVPASLCGAPQLVFPVRLRAAGHIVGASVLGARGSDHALAAAVRALVGGAPALEA